MDKQTSKQMDKQMEQKLYVLIYRWGWGGINNRSKASIFSYPEKCISKLSAINSFQVVMYSQDQTDTPGIKSHDKF